MNETYQHQYSTVNVLMFISLFLYYCIVYKKKNSVFTYYTNSIHNNWYLKLFFKDTFKGTYI